MKRCSTAFLFNSNSGVYFLTQELPDTFSFWETSCNSGEETAQDQPGVENTWRKFLLSYWPQFWCHPKLIYLQKLLLSKDCIATGENWSLIFFSWQFLFLKALAIWNLKAIPCRSWRRRYGNPCWRCGKISRACSQKQTGYLRQGVACQCWNFRTIYGG